MLPNDLENIGVLGDYPERIKAVGFHSAERKVRAKPPKRSQKRFLLRIGFWRDDQTSEALRQFFSVMHLPLDIFGIRHNLRIHEDPTTLRHNLRIHEDPTTRLRRVLRCAASFMSGTLNARPISARRAA